MHLRGMIDLYPELPNPKPFAMRIRAWRQNTISEMGQLRRFGATILWVGTRGSSRLEAGKADAGRGGVGYQGSSGRPADGAYRHF